MLCAFSFLFSWSPLLNDQVLGPPPRIRPPLQQPPMRYGVVMVWHCVVWYCMICYRKVWYGMAPLPHPPPHCALMQKYPESSYADCVARVAPTDAKHITEGVCKYISLKV